MVARDNTETIRWLVQTLNVTALVLATVLPLGSTALTWWIFFRFFIVVGRPKAQQKPNWGLQFPVQAVFVRFVDFFAMPLLYGAIYSTLESVSPGLPGVSRRGNRP
jgi:hypothetical protein